VATFRSDVLNISYAELGDPSAPPVILAHGWPDAARGWREVAEQLVGLGWRVLLPDNRGTGATTFRAPETVRDGSGVALARDILDLADGLGLERFAIVGHDWGARAAYTVAALAPQRVTAIAALALAFQPRGAFVMPSFSQARAFWYQWLMYVDAGVEAIQRDPVGFAREQWDTWSPPGWFDDAEFAATASAFGNRDWPAITLNAYRARFRPDEPLDARYDSMRQRLAQVDRIDVATLMIQGGADYCDEPASSDGLDRHFRRYRRVVLDGVGHFPHREAPAAVADLVQEHLDAHREGGTFGG
jgi:pimeloyl-ACP methyl ester carboxylesterase